MRIAPHSQAQSPPKKKRKQRQYFSCAECRRLKLKCDRQGELDIMEGFVNGQYPVQTVSAVPVETSALTALV